MSMTSDEEKVFAALREHRGRANDVKGVSLAEKLNLSHRRLHEGIESLITVHGVPIGSDPVDGYYIIATEDAYLKARHKLFTRLVELGRRLKALESAYRRYVAQPCQISLFEEQQITCA